MVGGADDDEQGIIKENKPDDAEEAPAEAGKSDDDISKMEDDHK